MMQRGVNKRWFFLIALLLLVVGVVAYNSSPANPATFGHSVDEIEGVCKTNGEGCPAGVGGGSGLGAPDYESGWLSLSYGQTLATLQHNLNTASFAQVQIILKSGTREVVYEGMSACAGSDAGYGTSGVYLFNTPTAPSLNTLSYAVGSYAICNAGSPFGIITSAQMKVRLWKQGSGSGGGSGTGTGSGGVEEIKIFAVPGTYSWTVPTGVTQARVRVWGAGGGAGGNSGTGGNGCVTVGQGGGSGAYFETIYTSLTSGTSIPVIVGAGGAGGAGGSGGAGGGSSVGTFTAGGGGGGARAAFNAGAGGAAPSGLSPSPDSLALPGVSTTTSTGASAPFGGDAWGPFPGAGGSGICGGIVAGASTTGGNGLVMITYSRGGSGGSGTTLADLRAGLEYISCTQLGTQGLPVSCTASCPTGKQAIGGSCSATLKPSNFNPAYPGFVASSVPTDSKQGWVCTAAKGGDTETATATGLAICL